MLIPRFLWRVPKIPLTDPQAASRVIHDELVSTMHEAVLLGQREVANRTPVGATSLLRGSIASEVRGTPAQVRGIVATPLGYARPVEEGTRPGIWRPIGPLKLWAQRVLGNERMAYQIRWAIYRRGTRGAHMFRDAERAIRQPVRQLFVSALARIRQKLGG